LLAGSSISRERSAVREFTIPPIVTVADDANLTDAVRQHASQRPDLVLFSRRIGDTWSDVTAAQFAREVSDAAKGLVAAGTQPGQRVGLMSKTRYEWSLIDYAIWTVGAVTVPVYETSSAEQVQWILSDSGAVASVVETPVHAATVDSVRDRLPELQHLWQLEDGAVDTLTGAGAAVDDAELDGRRAAMSADDPATIIYTNRTTRQ